MAGSRQRVAHLTASPFFGGPERQMVGLARAMPAHLDNSFICLMEGGKARPFVSKLRQAGFEAIELRSNYPHLIATVRETATVLRHLDAGVLLTHGYKSDIIGLPAARLAGIPIVMVSRGWTGASRKVRMYEVIDRCALRRADHVVCVSEGQAAKVRAARVASQRVSVLHNAIDADRFSSIDPEAERQLRALLPETVSHIVMAVGRLSPEKGFDLLIDAAARVHAERGDVGFILIGDGPEKAALLRKIHSLSMQSRFVLAGFREDVDRLLPHATLLAQSSHTEGMPNVVLEAMAASLPVVATQVGGTPELVVHGETGHLVPPADAAALASGILSLLDDSLERARMGTAARNRIECHFTFGAQARGYEQLLERIVRSTESTVSETSTAVARVAS